MDLEPFATAHRAVVVDDPKPPKHAMQEARPSPTTVESTPKDTPKHATQEACPSSKPIGVTSSSHTKPTSSPSPSSTSSRDTPAMRLRKYLAEVGALRTLLHMPACFL